MRITRETLLKIARDTVKMRIQKDRSIICVYLVGSLLKEEPLIGGTGDIDLIFVHDVEPLIGREITRLSDEIHLDIAHYSQDVYRQPRHLRVDPWIGTFLCLNPLALHDSHHWFEFTQASVCAQFNRPEYVLERARFPGNQGRQLWMDLRMGNAGNESNRVLTYLKIMENSANALACFSGPPLTMRRFFLHLPEVAKAVGRPGMAGGLIDLLSENEIPAETWQSWQSPWLEALDAAGQMTHVPAGLNLQRKNYYTRAAAALWETDPVSSVWIALRTWTQAVDFLGDNAPSREQWQAALRAVGLHEENFSTRLDTLDSYLDNVEEILDEWAHEYGIETNI